MRARTAPIPPRVGGSRRRIGVFVVVLTALVGCAYVPLPPLSADLTTRTLEPDERALWKKSRELQHKIRISGLLYEEPALDAYLAEILRRVTPPELVAASLEPRVQVVSNVNIHGYSFANGVIYLHTGLLARMRDETQLATVLSRELAHVVHRHALRTQRDKRAQADTLAWVGLGASVVDGGSQVKLLVEAASITSAVGFHHLLETAADEKGLAALAAAGYDVRETPAFFQMTIDDLARVHRQGVWGWVPFTPPPQMTARIAGYQALIDAHYSGRPDVRPPVADPGAFRRTIHGATKRQAELELAAGLFLSADATARAATESIAKDPDAWVLLARALNGQRSKPLPAHPVPSIQSVRDALDTALRADPLHPAATRELGMTYYRTTGTSRSPQARREAVRNFRRYLDLAPGAGDANYVREYLRELGGESRP